MRSRSLKDAEVVYFGEARDVLGLIAEDHLAPADPRVCLERARLPPYAYADARALYTIGDEQITQCHRLHQTEGVENAVRGCARDRERDFARARRVPGHVRWIDRVADGQRSDRLIPESPLGLEQRQLGAKEVAPPATAEREELE